MRQIPPFFRPWTALLWASVLALPVATSTAAEPDAGWQAEFSSIVDDLDSDDYMRRQDAAERLDALAERKSTRPALAAEVRRLLASDDLSLEARLRLEDVAEQLPRAPQPASAGSDDDLQATIEQLESNRFAVRANAQSRLRAMLADPKNAESAYRLLKARVSRPDADRTVRLNLEPVLMEARGAWLQTDPALDTTSIDDTTLERCLNQISNASDEQNEILGPRDLARLELMDALARDADTDRVKAAIEARLASPQIDPLVRQELAALLDWTRPGLTVEIWAAGQIITIQKLIVGLPQRVQGMPEARNPVLFDSIDENTGHCVVANTLMPGAYPVGVFFPHPQNDFSQFHLINQPTARRRMAYDHLPRELEAVRREQISERTMKALVDRGAPLAWRELNMLRYMSPGPVSRHAGKILLSVDDQPAERTINAFEQPGAIILSHHQSLCMALALNGTSEAIPDLLEAIRKKRVHAPEGIDVPALDWIAALTITMRDPWPGSDQWLAGLCERTDQLTTAENGADLGATAAGLLLLREGEEPARWGLDEWSDPITSIIGARLFRYRSQHRREILLRRLPDFRKPASDKNNLSAQAHNRSIER